MLLTYRPNLLPIDIKRQGGAEVHIPFFHLSEEKEIFGPFLGMAKKLSTELALEDVSPLTPKIS